jgi:hypothetical protein
MPLLAELVAFYRNVTYKDWAPTEPFFSSSLGWLINTTGHFFFAGLLHYHRLNFQLWPLPFGQTF